MPGIEGTSVIIAACSLVIALLTFAVNRSSEGKTSTAAFTEVSVKLSLLSGQLSDIQKDLKASEGEIQRLREDMDRNIEKVRLIAQHAQDRADAAHNRLDRAHVDTKEE